MMFVHTRTGKKSPPLVFPLVLQIAAVNVYRLEDVVVISDGNIMKPVVRILQAGHKLGRHKQEAVHRMGPL